MVNWKTLKLRNSKIEKQLNLKIVKTKIVKIDLISGKLCNMIKQHNEYYLRLVINFDEHWNLDLFFHIQT